jgi:hypothetical protein
MYRTQCIAKTTVSSLDTCLSNLRILELKLLPCRIIEVRKPNEDADSDGEVIEIEPTLPPKKLAAIDSSVVEDTDSTSHTIMRKSTSMAMDVPAKAATNAPAPHKKGKSKERPVRSVFQVQCERMLLIIYCSGKRKHEEVADDESSGKDTEDEKQSAKRSTLAKSSRAPKKSALVRKAELEADKWLRKVEEKRVLCKGCNKWKGLHRVYEIKEWEKHKAVCPGITGTKKVRTWKPSMSGSVGTVGRLKLPLLPTAKLNLSTVTRCQTNLKFLQILVSASIGSD